MPSRVTWIQAKNGAEVLRFDPSGANREEQRQMLEDYAREMQGKPERSVRLLLVVSNFDFHPDLLTRARQVFHEQSPAILRSAVIGSARIMKLAIETYIDAARLMGRSTENLVKPFDDEEAAIAWLAED